MDRGRSVRTRRCPISSTRCPKKLSSWTSAVCSDWAARIVLQILSAMLETAMMSPMLKPNDMFCVCVGRKMVSALGVGGNAGNHIRKIVGSAPVGEAERNVQFLSPGRVVRIPTLALVD